jgi:hypothetical protein
MALKRSVVAGSGADSYRTFMGLQNSSKKDDAL